MATEAGGPLRLAPGAGRGRRAVDGRRAGLGLARAVDAAAAAVADAAPHRRSPARRRRCWPGWSGWRRCWPCRPGPSRSRLAAARTPTPGRRQRQDRRPRYDLAVEAIKTFHTGVSEDFLLKEEQFKELRDRLLKSAADFYGKLGALLGKETDLRLAAGAGAGELRAGRPDRARSAARRTRWRRTARCWRRREALAAEPGADAGDDGRRRPQPDGRRRPAGSDRQDRRGGGDLPPGGVAAGGLARQPRRRRGPRWRPAGRGWAGSCRPRARPPRPWRPTGWRGPIRRRWPRAPERRTTARRDLADTINRIGILLEETGKPAEAEAEYRKALAIRQKLADDNPAVTEFRSRLADSHNNLGVLLRETGKPAEAEAEYRKALAIQQKLADDNPAVTEFRSDLAVSHDNLGMPAVGDGQAGGGGGRVPQGAGDPAEAGRRQPRRHRLPQVAWRAATTTSAACCRTRASRRRRRPSTARRWRSCRSWPTTTPPSPTSASDLASSHNNLGSLLSSTGKPAEAEAEYRKALAIQQKLADDNPAVTDFRSSLANSHNNLGVLLSSTGKPAEAEAEYRKALAIRQKLADDNPAVTEFRSRPGEQPPSTSAACCATRASRRRRRPSAARPWRSCRSWPTIIRSRPITHTCWAGRCRTWPKSTSGRNGSRRPARDFARRSSGRRRPWPPTRGAPSTGSCWRSICTYLSKAARGLGREDEAIEAERELAELDASDPRSAALDARLAAMLKGERRRTTPSGWRWRSGPTTPSVTPRQHGSGPEPLRPIPSSPTTPRPGIATTPPAPRRWPVAGRARTIHRLMTPPRSSCAARPSIGSTPNWLPGQRSSNPARRKPGRSWRRPSSTGRKTATSQAFATLPR